MGGEGSGRKPDVLKQVAEQRTAIANVPGDSIYIPNYSGLKKEALKTSSGNIARISSGRYEGDGNATQEIIGLGFQPRFVFVKGEDDSIVAFAYASASGTVPNAIGLYQSSGVMIDGYISAVSSDGFTVSSTEISPGVTLNGLSVAYNWVAIG